MNKLERVLIAILVLALVLKGLRLPMASLLLILSLSTLATLYLCFSWRLLPQPLPQKQVLRLGVQVGFALAIGLVGILYKLQIWPMSNFFLLIGSAGLAVLILIILRARKNQPELAEYHRPLLRRAIPVCLACAFLYALPVRSLVAFYYRGDPELQPLMIRLHTSADAKEREGLRIMIDSIQEGRYRTDHARQTTATE